jgi:peptidoglycan/LPS O-acetylase OafA/YrhL
MSSATGHLPSLTGLRGLAALWVLAFHMQVFIALVAPGASATEVVTKAGYLGVDLFFALSGFVIAHAYGARLASDTNARSWWQFMWRRFARIYPVHLFVIVLLSLGILASRVVGRDLAAGGDFGIANLVRHLTLTHVWLPGGSASWNAPSWSIHAEWFVYGCFPLFAARLMKVTRVRWMLAAATLGYVALIVLFQAGLDGNYDRTYDVGVLRAVVGFSAGAMIWRAWVLGAFNARWIQVLASAWPFLLLGVLVGDAPAGLVLPMVALLVPATVVGRGAFMRMLATRPLLYLGRISYALYMIHSVALIQLQARLPMSNLDGVIPRLLMLCGYVAVIVIAAHLLHRYVEEPMRGLLLGQRVPTSRVRA